MGPTEGPSNDPKNQDRRKARRPRTRRCLLKGCEKRYRPKKAAQRYCSPECRQAARKWSLWKGQRKYRGTQAGKEKRQAQCRRNRERVKARRKPQLKPAPETARVITSKFFRMYLRPARLLRDVHAQPKIPVATFLLKSMPEGYGTSLGAGTALEENSAPTRGESGCAAVLQRRSIHEQVSGG